MSITTSPTIYRLAPTSYPDAPPKKKPRTKSPTTIEKIPLDTESEYPLHDFQGVYSVKYKTIVKANRPQRDDEDFNVDLQAFVDYHRDN